MVETKKRIFLYDRWYYLLKETNDKITYTTKPENKLEGNLLEFNKNNHEIEIIYFENQKALGKLSISSIDEPNLTFNYTEFECSDLIIDDELYTNLLIKLSMKSKNGRIEGPTNISFIKKEKLNKICYREPNLKLNKNYDLKDIDLKTEMITEIIEFINYFPKITSVFTKDEVIKNNTLNEINTSEEREFNIPDELEIYDRVYKLVKTDDNKYIYINTESEIINLEVSIDPTILKVMNISLQTKEKLNDDANTQVIEIMPNQENGITAKYYNIKNLNVNLNGTELEKVKINAEITYDSNHQKVENRVKLISGKEHYCLLGHPTYKLEYVDDNGNMYRISNKNYAQFQCISGFACGIYNHVDKRFFKQKVLMKK